MSERCEKHGVTRCMLCRVKEPTTVVVPAAELDRQAAEAAERLADTTVPEVDFGDVEAAWNGENPISVAAHVEAVMNRAMVPIVHPEPMVPIAPRGTHLAGNPIVDAAASYASAQETYTRVWNEILELESDLDNARKRLEEAKGDRDMKKQVLQALVGGAS
ncbi:MAG: hypothetical protein WCC95_18125 [Candidatus Sulfotelmatobacter sp.]